MFLYTGPNSNKALWTRGSAVPTPEQRVFIETPKNPEPNCHKSGPRWMPEVGGFRIWTRCRPDVRLNLATTTVSSQSWTDGPQARAPGLDEPRGAHHVSQSYGRSRTNTTVSRIARTNGHRQTTQGYDIRLRANTTVSRIARTRWPPVARDKNSSRTRTGAGRGKQPGDAGLRMVEG